ncbi:MAG: VCBS repeat-containing protein [Myxococcota bacterium]
MKTTLSFVLVVFALASDAWAVGVGATCANRTCDAGLSCSRTPILKRCVPTPEAYAPQTRTFGQSCFDGSDCEEDLVCTGGNSNRPHKKKCLSDPNPDVTSMRHGDVFACSCGTRDVIGGRVVKPGDRFIAGHLNEKLVAKFDIERRPGDGVSSAIDAVQELIVSPLDKLPIPNPVDALVDLFQDQAMQDKPCVCAVVEDLRANWTPSDGGVDGTEGYPSACVGLCGPQCGKDYVGLTSDLRRYGSLIVHDVCQAYIGSTASITSTEGATNVCSDEGFIGARAALESSVEPGVGKHRCGPQGPPLDGTEFESTVAASGSAIVVAGDFNGDGLSDLFSYGPGDEPDTLHINRGESIPFDVTGDYVPVSGDFDGNGATDIFWYRPGPSRLWLSNTDGTFAGSSIEVGSANRRIFHGDFNGDGASDLFLWAPGSTRDEMWLSNHDGTFTSVSKQVNSSLIPLVADFDGSGTSDILWYHSSQGEAYLHIHDESGSVQWSRHYLPKGLSPTVGDLNDDRLPDVLWSGELGWLADGEGGFSPVDMTLPLSATLQGDFDGDGSEDAFHYRAGPAPEALVLATGEEILYDVEEAHPLVADFNGDGRTDVFWHGRGSAADHLWLFQGDGSYERVSHSVSKDYQPILGDFNGDGRHDILWYRPGSASDYLWLFRQDGTRSRREPTINGTYAPIVADFNGDGTSDIFFYAPGTANDYLWLFNGSGGHTSRPMRVDGTYLPSVEDFNGDGLPDILWQGQGPEGDSVWQSTGDGFIEVAP